MNEARCSEHSVCIVDESLAQRRRYRPGSHCSTETKTISFFHSLDLRLLDPDLALSRAMQRMHSWLRESCAELPDGH
jgi:hypothetical protein